MRSALVAVVGLLVAAGCSARPEASATSAPGRLMAAVCSPDPMAHVYASDRLRILDPCLTVTGRVTRVDAETDGDEHVLIALDPGQLCDGRDCLNDHNRSDQGDQLVAEAVCMHTVTDRDAINACIGFRTLLPVPTVGMRVSVTGPWVIDDWHGWTEIHPVEALNVPSGPAGS